jgi:hypothetical protein
LKADQQADSTPHLPALIHLLDVSPQKVVFAIAPAGLFDHDTERIVKTAGLSHEGND